MSTTDDIKEALATIAARHATDQKVRQYYAGVQRLNFATQKFLNAFGPLVRAFADNLCPCVCDSVADRLEIEGFTVEDGGSDLGDLAWALWLRNRMDRRAGEVHLEALKTGDAYVIVWPDDQNQPVIYPNRSDRMMVVYDEETLGKIDFAAKVWLQRDQSCRLTLYYPDRIEKYVTSNTFQTLPDTAHANAFQPYQPAGEPWPLPNSWGVVPVFHFANNASTGEYGRSELADVLPLQDAVNKSIADRLVGSEFMALPQRWVTGFETPFDEDTGKPKEIFKPGPDRIWTAADADVKFGQFDAAHLADLRGETDDYRLAIARVSRTPLHYLMPTSGDFPSGEALRVAETPFTAKVRDRQSSFSSAWEDAMALALVQSSAASQVAAVRLRATWKDPESHSELERVQTLILKGQIGVSQPQLLAEAGYGEDQIAKMETEKAQPAVAMGGSKVTSYEPKGAVPGSGSIPVPVVGA